MDPEIEVRKVATAPRSTLSGIVLMTIAVAVILAAIVLIAKYGKSPPPPTQIERTQTPPSP